MITTVEDHRDLIAGNVRALLGWKGMSATELGRHLGMKQTTISNKVRGRTLFSVDELQAIARVFGLRDAGVFLRVYWEFGPPGPLTTAA